MENIIQKIIQKVDFQNKLLVFLRNIYNDDMNIDHQIKKGRGRKNQTNSFEEYIETKCKEFFPNGYKLHPNGCQKPPDFILFDNHYQVSIECKSSNSYIPTWNCSIPQEGWIYIHKNTKTQHMTFFQAKDIMSQEESLELKQISQKVSKFASSVSSRWTYYPRNMFIQRKQLPIQRDVMFKALCQDLSFLIQAKKQEEFSQMSKEITKELSMKEKKEYGIFFTPRIIRKKLLQTIPCDFQDKKILEPSCGGGDFLQDCQQYNITGIEWNKTIFEKIKQKYKNVINKDFLLWNSKTKFDIILGNPPYFLLTKTQKELYKTKTGKVNIFELFIYKALSLLKKGCFMSFVLPTSLMNAQMYEELRKEIMKYEIIACLKTQDEFLDTKQECFILTIQKLKNKTKKYIYKNYLIFEEDRNLYKTIYKNSNLLKNLPITIETGKIVWNQHKDQLSTLSTNPILLYDFNIQNNQIVLYPEQYNNKGQYIKTNKETLNEPVLVIARGNGNGNWGMKCALVDLQNFLCENHLYVIRGDLNCLKQIYKQFISKEFQKFIKMIIPNKCLTKQNLLDLPIKTKY